MLDTWDRNVLEVGSINDLAEKEEEAPFVVTKREIKQRLNKIEVFLENPERLRRIAEHLFFIIIILITIRYCAELLSA